MSKTISSICEAVVLPVKTVAGIVERNQTVPVLNNIMIEQNGTDVVFTTTDLDIQIRTNASVGAEGTNNVFTVNAQKFSDVINSISANQLVELEYEPPMLKVATAGGSFQIQTLPAQDFPALEPFDAAATFEIPGKTLRHLLTMTSFAMASKDVRFYLTAVLLIIEGGTVRCVATDTHRLAYCEASLENAPALEEKLEIILPRKSVRELLRLLPEDDAPVKVSIGELQALFTFNGIEFVTKLIDGKFPDYERVLPTLETNPCPVDINREALVAALRRVQIMMNDRFNGVRWILSRGLLQMQSNNNEQEEATQDIPVDWRWDNLDLGFNIIYLLEVLSVLKTSNVRFHFAPLSKSVLVTMPDSMSFRYVVMPMRI